jgi:hypothetical protein
MQSPLKRWISSALFGVFLLLLPLGSLVAHSADSLTSPTVYPPSELSLTSQEVPAGTTLKIRFLTALDSKTSNMGDGFVAMAIEDVFAGRQLVLPKGTPVRGRVAQVQRPGFFSKGGLMRLTFDHVMLPNGELQSMRLDLDAASAKVDRTRNALYTDPGIGAKLESSVDKGVNQYKSLVDKAGQNNTQNSKGYNMLMTVPVALAGVASGTAVTTASAAKAILGRGESVTIVPGDELVIDIAQAVSLQGQ